MATRSATNRLYYFTIEDEGMLAEAIPQLEKEFLAVAYKVMGTEDVFVTTRETKEALDRHDVPYNLLAEEEGHRVSLHHSALSREELTEYEDAVRALALAHRAVAMACVGVNGETNLGFDLSKSSKQYTYFSAPAGHTFIWRWFSDRKDAVDFLSKFASGDKKALEWAQSIPLATNAELKSYH
jgi:hypothetical protein